MSERDDLVTRLGEAMDNGEFEMFFQPEFAADGRPVARLLMMSRLLKASSPLWG